MFSVSGPCGSGMNPASTDPKDKLRALWLRSKSGQEERKDLGRIILERGIALEKKAPKMAKITPTGECPVLGNACKLINEKNWRHLN